MEKENAVQSQPTFDLPPDDALLLRLLPQPLWPLVRHELVLEAILLGEVRQELLCSGNGKGFQDISIPFVTRTP